MLIYDASVCVTEIVTLVLELLLSFIPVVIKRKQEEEKL